MLKRICLFVLLASVAALAEDAPKFTDQASIEILRLSSAKNAKNARALDLQNQLNLAIADAQKAAAELNAVLKKYEQKGYRIDPDVPKYVPNPAGGQK